MVVIYNRHMKRLLYSVCTLLMEFLFFLISVTMAVATLCFHHTIQTAPLGATTY